MRGSHIQIPKLGWARIRESLRFQCLILSATSSRIADKWYVSMSVETPDNLPLPQAENQGVVGVNLGIKVLATLSNGETISPPRPLKRLRNRLVRLSRSLSRKVKDSSNRNKAKVKLSRLRAQVANIRSHTLH